MTKEEFKAMIIENYMKGKKIVFVNIGTEKCIGDSFAPMLGSMLQDKLDIIKVYGTLDKTVNGINIVDKMKVINDKHKNDFIIGVDAAFSTREESYNQDFMIYEESFIAGAGLNKDLPEVGHVCIKFCIEKKKEDGYEALKMFNIKEIYNRAKKAANFIFEIDEELSQLEV